MSVQLARDHDTLWIFLTFKSCMVFFWGGGGFEQFFRASTRNSRFKLSCPSIQSERMDMPWGAYRPPADQAVTCLP